MGSREESRLFLLRVFLGFPPLALVLHVLVGLVDVIAEVGHADERRTAADGDRDFSESGADGQITNEEQHERDDEAVEVPHLLQDVEKVDDEAAKVESHGREQPPPQVVPILIDHSKAKQEEKDELEVVDDGHAAHGGQCQGEGLSSTTDRHGWGCGASQQPRT